MVTCHTVRVLTAVLVTSLLAGGKRGRREMGAQVALSPGGGGAWWNQAPKSWWDSTCFCGDLAQGKWTHWGRGGLVSFLVRCQLLAKLVRAAAHISGCLLGVLSPYTEISEVGHLILWMVFHCRFSCPPWWKECCTTLLLVLQDGLTLGGDERFPDSISRAGVSLWWDRAACFALAWGLHLAWAWQEENLHRVCAELPSCTKDMGSLLWICAPVLKLICKLWRSGGLAKGRCHYSY